MVDDRTTNCVKQVRKMAVKDEIRIQNKGR